MILAGDIGGTKTDLALFSHGDKKTPIKYQRFSSKEHKSLEDILRIFLNDTDGLIEVGCFGVAGPVEQERCKATNLPWIIEAQVCQKVTGAKKVFLINDLVANAWGLSLLSEKELYILSAGAEGMEGNRALISAGTGLGQAGLYFDGKEHYPFASEGGHCNFAPNNEEEVCIWRYLQKKFGHVSYERILCGDGFFHLYQYWVEEKKQTEHPEVKQRFLSEDKAKVIYEYGMSGQCPICVKVVHRFISIYGSEAGNVALKFLSLGGIYIGGGIAPKILEGLKSSSFLESFRQKGRFEPLLSQMKVQVILNPQTALLGAATYGKRHL